MPNIAAVLKQEITRLARKEAKTATGTMRKAGAQHRRDIAELKRQVKELSSRLASVERQDRKRASAAPPETSANGRRFSPRGLRTHRERLDLSAADYAELVGVSAQTIYNWERGTSKPRAQQLAALVAIRDLGKREAWKRLDG